MIAPTPTAYPGVFTVSTTNAAELGRLTKRLNAAPMLAIASPSLARLVAAEAGPMPPLPAGSFRDALVAEAAAAGVPEFAVLTVTLALTDAAMPATALPSFLADVQLPPTWIVGARTQCEATLRAAEAVVAATPYRANR
jgi:hypothetical protein